MTSGTTARPILERLKFAFEDARYFLRGNCAMTQSSFEKLTRGLLLCGTAAYAVCYFGELKSATFHFVVQHEKRAIQYRSEIINEALRNHNRSLLNRNAPELELRDFESTASSDQGNIDDLL